MAKNHIVTVDDYLVKNAEQKVRDVNNGVLVVSSKTNKKNIYIVCSVRGLEKEEKKEIDEYVADLESKGYQVRLPYRDTNQNDEFGMRIVEEHEEDIIWADEIHVWWNPDSSGSHWDMGGARMAQKFMPEKKIILANTHKLTVNKGKTYGNVLLAMHLGLTNKNTHKDLENAKKINKE